LTQIKEYEAIYRANLAVASYPNTQRMVSRRKRAEDDEDNSREDDRKRALIHDEPTHEPVHDLDAMET